MVAIQGHVTASWSYALYASDPLRVPIQYVGHKHTRLFCNCCRSFEELRRAMTVQNSQRIHTLVADIIDMLRELIWASVSAGVDTFMHAAGNGMLVPRPPPTPPPPFTAPSWSFTLSPAPRAAVVAPPPAPCGPGPTPTFKPPPPGAWSAPPPFQPPPPGLGLTLYLNTHIIFPADPLDAPRSTGRPSALPAPPAPPRPPDDVAVSSTEGHSDENESWRSVSPSPSKRPRT